MAKIKAFLKDKSRVLIPLLIILGLASFVYLGYPGSLGLLTSRMGLVVWLLTIVGLRAGWALVNNQRKQRMREAKAGTFPKPMLPPFSASWRDWWDLTWFVDEKKRRMINYGLTAATLAATLLIPVGRIKGKPVKEIGDLTQGWASGSPLGTIGMVLALGLPLAWFGFLAKRCREIGSARRETVGLIYNLAATFLKYPVKSTRVRPEEQPFQSARSAIQVQTWSGLTSPEKFWVSAPLTLDSTDGSPWNAFQSNLEVKFPSNTGWQIQKDEKGRGATIFPASYPTSVLWEGQQHPDPLTFFLGADLDKPGELLTITFSDVTPHGVFTGGTGSGKALPADSMIVTPTGLVRNGDLSLDDLVIDRRGLPAKINTFSEWKDADVYRMHFDDGTFLDSTLDHRHSVVDLDRVDEVPDMDAEEGSWIESGRLAALSNEVERLVDDHITLEHVARVTGLSNDDPTLTSIAKALGMSFERTVVTADGESTTVYYPATMFAQALSDANMASASRRSAVVDAMPHTLTTQEVAERLDDGRRSGILVARAPEFADRKPQVSVAEVVEEALCENFDLIEEYAFVALAYRQALYEALREQFAIDNRWSLLPCYAVDTVSSLVASLGLVARREMMQGSVHLVVSEAAHREIVAIERVSQGVSTRCIGIDSPTHEFLVGSDFLPTHNTSGAEAIMAQAATYTMDYSDPDDPIHPQVTLIDPKGAAAQRWEGRPNIHTVNGTMDTVNEDGETISGIQAMSEALDKIYNQMTEQNLLIQKYRVAKWLDLPPEVLREHRIAPQFIVLDEYLDHTDKLSGKSDQTKADQQARDLLVEKALEIARKGRSIGFHLIVIAQTANMTLIGSAFMRQLVVRVIMANMDDSAYMSFFGTNAVPLLPTQAVRDGEVKSIPGRGRVQYASGQELHRVQMFWFGGKKNDETLDKFLPSSIQRGSLDVASNDIEEFDIDDSGEPLVDLDDDVLPTKVGETVVDPDAPVPVPTGSTTAPKQQVKPEAKVEPKKKAPAKPAARPKPATKKPSAEVISADEIFPARNAEPQESTASSGLACEECGTSSGRVAECANPKCERVVCGTHRRSPDGRMWVCEECGKSHILSRMRLGSLYPWVRSTVEDKGGTVTWSKQGTQVNVSVQRDGIEVLKIIGRSNGVEGMSGKGAATTPDGIRKMVKDAFP